MKTKQVEVSIYEIGDVLDVSKLAGTRGKLALSRAKRAVIIDARELKSGQQSYGVLTNDGAKVRVTPDDMHGERYIGKIDMSALFSEDDSI